MLTLILFSHNCLLLEECNKIGGFRSSGSVDIGDRHVELGAGSPVASDERGKER